MKTLYLDLFSGISGDMFLGALIDLGVDFHQLEQELAKLPLEGYHLHVVRKQNGKIEGVKFDVHLEAEHAHTHAADAPAAHSRGHHHSHEKEASPPPAAHDHGHARTFAEIKQLLSRSPFSDWVKQKAIAVFHRIALAEGKVHGEPTESVHFHEVGAIDSIVDIVGGCLGLEWLGKPRVLASAVVEGTGWIDCAHGRLPIPAPATLEILSARHVPISQCEEPHELVTPTGAGLLAELVDKFGPMQGLVPAKVGYGLGTRENRTRPNVLRAVLCEAEDTTHDWEIDTVAVLQTNLDDINAEILGRVLKLAMEQGALDVFHTPIQMKKNRPGVMLSVLCAEADADKFTELLLRETSAFGVRRYTAERRKLQREFTVAQTPHGQVAIKIGKLNGAVVQAAPEYESCQRLADQTGLPLKLIYEAAYRSIKV